MKLHSKYFDSIRIARPGEPKKAAPRQVPCQWKGCSRDGNHRAPRGRGQEGHYRFCIDHVRQFNATYNYFDGMSNAEVEAYQKNASTGHRPTWRMGDNAGQAGRSAGQPGGRYARFAQGAAVDSHGVFDDDGPDPQKTGRPEPRRPLRALERRALDTLHLSDNSTKAEIKAKFKELVKRHHPDANGGDRGSEDKLREIIQAYNYLKQAGLV